MPESLRRKYRIRGCLVAVATRTSFGPAGLLPTAERCFRPFHSQQVVIEDDSTLDLMRFKCETLVGWGIVAEADLLRFIVERSSRHGFTSRS